MGADPKKEYLDSLREMIIELIDGCQDLTLLDLVYKRGYPKLCVNLRCGVE